MAEKTDKKTDEKTLIRKAYTKATTALREENRLRFNELMHQKCAELGVEWKPRKSAEEKAREKVNTLLAEHPNLQERLKEALLERETDEQAVGVPEASEDAEVREIG